MELQDRIIRGGGKDNVEEYVHWCFHQMERRLHARGLVEVYRNGEINEGISMSHSDLSHGDGRILIRKAGSREFEAEVSPIKTNQASESVFCPAYSHRQNSLSIQQLGFTATPANTLLVR